MKLSYETPVFTSRNPGFLRNTDTEFVCGLQFVYAFAVLRLISNIPTFSVALCVYDVTMYAVQCRAGTTFN